MWRGDAFSFLRPQKPALNARALLSNWLWHLDEVFVKINVASLQLLENRRRRRSFALLFNEMNRKDFVIQILKSVQRLVQAQLCGDSKP
jgi:hypothetical protein